MKAWNSTFNAGTKPMKRSPMNRGTSTLKRSPMARGMTGILRTASIDMSRKQRKPLKSHKTNMTPIRKSAKNENCTLRFRGICKNRVETTVWCHSNLYQDGKGLGLKARDEEGCYGCFECHSFLDGGWVQYPEWTREMVDAVFDRARHESRGILQRKKLLAGEVAR